MRVFATGTLCALFLMTTSLLAQPALFSTDSKGATPQFASSAQKTHRVNANADLLRNESRVDFNLFDDLHLIVNRTRDGYEGTVFVWNGEIEGSTGSQVTLIIDGWRIVGGLQLADGTYYQIQPNDDGSHSVEFVDARQAVTDDEAIEPPAELLNEKGEDRAAARSMNEALAVGQSTIDLLAVYTAEARAALGSTQAIVNKIQLAVAQTNQGYINSGINMQLRLVGTQELPAQYSADQAANSTYLSRVTNDSGTVNGVSLGQIRQWRDAVGADMVSVWIHGPGAGGGTVGIAWIMNNPSTSFQSVAFSVVEQNFSVAPYYSFAHELGHNMGGAHDRTTSNNVPGAYPYAFGHRTSGQYGDIMAYTGSVCSCSRVNQFSNPNVTYNNWVTGVATTASNSADLSTTFNATRTFVEQWRATVVPSAPAPTPAPTPTNAAPTVTSLSPSAGTASAATYSAVYTDTNGAADIKYAYLSVQGTSSSYACQVQIETATKAIRLRDNNDASWVTGATLGQAASISNSQCTVSGTGGTLTQSGNTTTLVLAVSFKSAFAGTRDIYLRADDAAGATSNWQKRGSWTVPAPTATVPATPPSFTSFSPASGSGRSATFSAVFTDPNGANEITRTIVLINRTLATSAGCYVYTLASSRTYYLLNSAGTSWLGPANIGNSLSNGNCTIASGNTLTVSGTTMTLTLPMSFGSSWIGAKTAYVNVADQNGAWQAWKTAGAFNVQ